MTCQVETDNIRLKAEVKELRQVISNLKDELREALIIVREPIKEKEK